MHPGAAGDGGSVDVPHAGDIIRRDGHAQVPFLLRCAWDAYQCAVRVNGVIVSAGGRSTAWPPILRSWIYEPLRAGAHRLLADLPGGWRAGSAAPRGLVRLFPLTTTGRTPATPLCSSGLGAAVEHLIVRRALV